MEKKTIKKAILPVTMREATPRAKKSTSKGPARLEAAGSKEMFAMIII
jgi:hypothetical protein